MNIHIVTKFTTLVYFFLFSLTILGCNNPTSDDESTTTSTVQEPTTTTVSFGNKLDDEFYNGIVGLSSNSIAFDGQTSVFVDFVDSLNNPIPEAIVQFTSECEINSQAQFSSTIVKTDINGRATTDYIANGCVGVDTISASVIIQNEEMLANTQLIIAQPSSRAIQFKSASHDLIALKGTGNSVGLPEFSTLTFLVLSSNGAPLSGVDVKFAINTTIGDIKLESSSQTSNSNGEVAVKVYSGTVITSIRVTASILDTDPEVATISNAISIGTGIPDQDSFSLSADKFNPRAWNIDGAEVIITARLADRFNNRVQDGTSVTFTTELGAIEPNCTVIDGSCSVVWTSQEPRQSLDGDNVGRTTILATVEGEESFLDRNSNGIFDSSADTGTVDTFTDMDEAFLDINENGEFDSAFEVFFDFNQNSIFDTGDNKYNGHGCKHAFICGEKSISVRESLVLIMAEDSPALKSLEINGEVRCNSVISCYSVDVSSVELPASFTFVIVGAQNEQVLPIGTTITFDADGDAGKVVGTELYTIYSTNADVRIDPGLVSYSAYVDKSVSDESDPGDGSTRIEKDNTGILETRVNVGDGGGSYSLIQIPIIETVVTYKAPEK
ncbi:MAG: Ig-like domain-containing protein [Gammaproteobacteria bacterium]|nr:Ig-like domain-containing protein [Gammaproteobacteria bacterium]